MQYSKLTIDVFILTNTKDVKYFEITKDAILSLKASEDGFLFNIFLIETNLNSDFDTFYNGLGCKLVYFNDDFAYSKAINYALRHGKSQYVLITNNDVKFSKNWFQPLFHLLNKDFAVCSTFDPNLNYEIENTSNIVEGYKPCGIHSGWCYLVDTLKLKEHKFLSEEYDIWYMDDDFCMRLQNLNLKQVLVKNSIVYHLGSSSIGIYENTDNRTNNDKRRFLDKYDNCIRINSVQFLQDSTIINFESFGDYTYEFHISGDIKYDTIIDMKSGIDYYISLKKINRFLLTVVSNNKVLIKNEFYEL